MKRPDEYRHDSFKPTIFNKIQDEIAARGCDPDAIIGLHVGDTWFDLPRELDRPLASEPWNSGLSRYGSTQGEFELRQRLFRKVCEKNNLPAKGPEEIQLTFGATGALFLAMRKLLEPGAEILTLAPYWAILRVVASTAGVTLVEVPVFDDLPEDPGVWEPGDLFSRYLSEKTAAIYFNSPNNPTGVLLRKGHLEKVAEFARENDLWVFSDEAYEDFVWVDHPATSIGSLEGMYERTISIFSMSKSYAAAGLRLGYTVAPTGVTAALNPAHVGAGYEPNRLAQVQFIRGLERRETIVPRLRKSYLECREAATAGMRVPYLRPEGSFYLFLDLRDRWAGLSEEQKLERMLRAGVVMSPGEAFGKEYDGWARFCYTAEPPERIAEAAKRVDKL